MASLNSVYVTKAKLEEVIDILNKKKVTGVEFTVAINDEMRAFTTKDGKTVEQNIRMYVSQSKEARDAGKEKFYVGNGKTFWSNVSQPNPQKSDPKKKESDKGINADDSDGLPF